MADVQLSTLGGVIKTAYEAEADTNAFTDAEKTKLAGAILASLLASTSAGEGSSLIGYEDTASLTLSTTVAAALNELFTTLDGYGTAVTLDQGDIVLQGGQDVIIFDAGGNSAATRPTQSATKTVIWFNHGSSLPTNLGTYDIAIGGGFGVASVNSQTGTTYTLVLGDAGFNVDMNNASANTLTIPTNASVAFSVGTCISVTMLGAGTTTVAGDTGVTVNGTSAGSVDINNQYSGCVIRKTATDTWVAQGDIT